ncbi:UDP-N-acetylglucosamine diphosphorylase/glucosamine-1-phosphate N-acetyltransferase [Candidatus Endobugula sertula]|uniref:Bifunctional protein GlmU n=1 Tax=Candidatus Endobugula sertula TaxID=62101 RepID=A0A1D2QNN6_9GAMM|nr:UDP-N-acetylglucosamine diphosphorylase/glucosamine-1-phosphate N-acetyltransferase [Candidatus Endobugula sertula]
MLDILILAAGKGTRMRSSVPKVLHPIAGKALIQHVIDTAKALTNNPLNIVVGHEADKVQRELSDQHTFILQEHQLGTGHAVQQALPHFRKDSIVLILYGDVPLISRSTLQRLINKVNKNSLALLTMHLDQPKGYGRITRNSSNKVTAIVEQKDATEEQLAINEVNTGVIAVSAQHLQKWLPELSNNNAQGEYYLTDIISMAQQQGVEINTEQPDFEWEVMGVNDRRQQAELERIYQLNRAKKLMAEGVTLIDPARFDCRGNVSVGQDVIIDINCLLIGEVAIGHNVSIGANCIIQNSVIGDNTVIKGNTIIEDSEVKADCTIGPFARLRPGTKLSEQAKIGNFVETKKALIGKGSKINHLSYVGDATLGDDVNIGAGTITCNYDGVNKHQTTIGNDVFVGSNSALVAPVNLEDGVTIGAGSTINCSVEKNTLSLTRSPQKMHKEWQRPIKK